MSSIDKRVVEMVDNNQFENGVKTTMSTLDKLKQGLSQSAEPLKDSGLMSRWGSRSRSGRRVHILKVQLLSSSFLSHPNITNRLVDMG